MRGLAPRKLFIFTLSRRSEPGRLLSLHKILTEKLAAHDLLPPARPASALHPPAQITLNLQVGPSVKTPRPSCSGPARAWKAGSSSRARSRSASAWPAARGCCRPGEAPAASAPASAPAARRRRCRASTATTGMPMSSSKLLRHSAPCTRLLQLEGQEMVMEWCCAGLLPPTTAPELVQHSNPAHLMAAGRRVSTCPPAWCRQAQGRLTADDRHAGASFMGQHRAL